MQQTDSNRNSPASLFLTIDDWDNVANAVIKNTSDENTRNYILQELDKIKDYEVIPDETVIEYRFFDRKAIPPFNPDLLNEYYGRDLYYVLDGKNIPRQYISLQMAAFLTQNNVDPLQSENTYRRIFQCPEYRGFTYLNSNGLLAKSHLLNSEDIAKLMTIRAEGGPALMSILAVRGLKSESTAIENNTVEPKIDKPHGHTKKPYIPSRRNVSPKRTKGRSM
ncbi:MAG: hypothetical protein LBV38_00870 [Alistipes sp.]|jgi:hypothetical protein|nr:hypothetical protein [Alistipes sp.]